ncbi:hypothetical protein [Pedobacter frigiditerrae]|uniref:hypothetical protein n=1 Tax=Pedobacter frigiditerrae TaxID=2530452 RepID=UPI00292DA11C|nr:hypothetical protein [Pedobacter frigiditerrae]
MKALHHLLLWPILFVGMHANSQTDTIRDFKNQKSIQLNLGTQGIGVEFLYGILPKLALRGGVNAIPLKANDIFKIEDFNSTTHASADFYNVHVLADYTPFQKASWLRLVGGFAYFFKADGKVRITPSDNYTYGDLVLSEEQVGYVDLNVDWKGVAPYLGLAFANTFPRKKFNVSFDLGTYYLSKPKADIIGTGLLEGNSSQTAQFQSNIKNYRWLPIVQVNFNYKF